jgi:tetratricopeptide (TPR) repeat protein
MLPRPHMVTTINLPIFKLLLGVFLGAMFVGCKPPGPKALLDGKRHLEKGRTAAAVDRLQAATQLIPTNAHAWNYLGIACHRSGLVSNAVQAYRRALQVDPDLSEVRLNLGTLQLEQGHLVEAKSEFTAYSLRRPNDPAGFKLLALAELQSGELMSAESHAQKAVTIDATDAEAWNALGLVQLRLRRNAEAIQSFKSALERQSDFSTARINLAVALQGTGNLPGALEQYRHYLKSKPRPADAGQIEQVINQIEAELRPKSLPPPHGESGRTPAQNLPNVQTQRVPNAKQGNLMLTSAPSTKPLPLQEARLVASNTTPSSGGSTGRAAPKPPALLASSAPGASNTIRPPAGKSVRVMPLPGDPPRTTNLSTNAVSMAASDKASNTQTAGRSSSLIAEKYAAQGAKALAARRYSEAADAFRSAANADPDWFQAQLNYSAAAIEAGRTEEAVRAGQRALALQPDSARARYNLALALKQAARYRESAAQLETLVAAKPADARAHLTLANLYAGDLGQLERARAHYLKVLEIEPGHPRAAEIHFWLVSNPPK